MKFWKEKLKFLGKNLLKPRRNKCIIFFYAGLLGSVGREPARETCEPGSNCMVTGPITSWCSRSTQSAAGIKRAVIGMSTSEDTDRTLGL